LKNPKNVIRVLQEFEKAGIENVELGSVHQNFDLSELKKFRFNFLIHNYFPPPKIPFNFNLASHSVSIRKRSIRLAKQAIELCEKINSPLYTFHAGFTVDPLELGKRFSRKNVINRDKAISIFLESLFDVLEVRKKLGVKLAMEPNVIQKFNLVNGRNELLLFADSKELEYLYKNVKKTDLGILLDLGHTAVTAHWLKFDKDEFVDFCKDKVFAVHISNNNGVQDQHKSLTKGCWQVTKLKAFKKTPIILETMNLTIEQIKTNIEIAESFVN
jgi:sugar phosphate isomerase/epimerase